MKPSFITDVDFKLLQEKYPNNLEEIIKKIENDYPVQYLIGSVPFLNVDIKVDERALIPRFETEELVQKVIDKFKTEQNLRILELGTGSGCISIALKKNLPCEIKAVDISSKALSLAQENALQNKVDILFEEISMFDVSYENYDIIISNPPYVKKEEYVSPNTKYEPSLALYAEEEGMEFYHKILQKISLTENKPRWVIFEMGAYQKEAMKNLQEKYLPDYHLRVQKDLAGRDRFVFFEKIV